MGDIALRQPWEELHATISTEEEFKEACNYKGLTCIEVVWLRPSSQFAR